MSDGAIAIVILVLVILPALLIWAGARESKRLERDRAVREAYKGSVTKEEALGQNIDKLEEH